MICQICNKEYIGHPNSKYCSDECRHIGKLKIMKKYNMSHYEERRQNQINFYKKHLHYCRDYDRFKRPYRHRKYNYLQD